MPNVVASRHGIEGCTEGEATQMLVKVTVVHEGQTYVGEAELRPVGAEKMTSKARASADQISGDYANKPSGAVELLYRQGFFKESHRLPDVCTKLQGDGYNFSRQSILMALKAAPFLALNGRRGAYSFVQKFPPRT